HLHGERARPYRGGPAVDRQYLPFEAQMRNFNLIADGGLILGTFDDRLARTWLSTARGVPQPLSALLEVGPALLARAKAFPLLVDRAADVGEQPLRLSLGPADGLAGSLLGRRQLRLRARQQPGTFRLSALDQRGALGVTPIPVVQPGQELLELALLSRSMRVSAFDQRGREPEAAAEGRRIAMPGSCVDKAEGRGKPGAVELH